MKTKVKLVTQFLTPINANFFWNSYWYMIVKLNYLPQTEIRLLCMFDPLKFTTLIFQLAYKIRDKVGKQIKDDFLL